MHDMVVLLDVDNTLLDNDRVRVELEAAVVDGVGPRRAARFWEIYEAVREELDHVDFPEAVERFGRECDEMECLGRLSSILYDFRFAACLYPQALQAIEHVKSLGLPVILTDGDQLFQRYKIRSAGLEAAVDGRVLVYVHKEQSTDDIRGRYPAAHYVVVDDKARIHAAMKAILGDLVTTVMVCQGHYAADPAHHDFPEADLTLESIGDLAHVTASHLRAAAEVSN